MVKCLKCERKIDRLGVVSSGIQYSDLSGYVVEGKLQSIDYENDTFESDGLVTSFRCPECGKELFKHEDDAISFLEGVLQDGGGNSKGADGAVNGKGA